MSKGYTRAQIRQLQYDAAKMAWKDHEDERLERQAKARVNSAGKRFTDMSEHELQAHGYHVTRGFFGGVKVERKDARQERQEILDEARRRSKRERKEDRKDAVKSAAKRAAIKAVKGSAKPKKRGFFYWE